MSWFFWKRFKRENPSHFRFLVEAQDCQFLPFTTVVRSGHGVEVINMDPVMHDIQAYETSQHQGTRVLFNSPLPL